MSQADPNMLDEPKPAIPRKCLKCGENFKSWGDGNRVCSRCKGTNAWRSSSPYEPMGEGTIG